MPGPRNYSGTPLNRPLHPTQLYEFVAEAINFAFLYWLCKRKKFEGQVIALFMIVYGTERFVFEFFRGDPGRGADPGRTDERNAVDRAGTGGERLLDLSSTDAAALVPGCGGGNTEDGSATVFAGLRPPLERCGANSRLRLTCYPQLNGTQNYISRPRCFA